ncbi:MAG: TonB-dependent receptor [Ginsengibacter sp.]
MKYSFKLLMVLIISVVTGNLFAQMPGMRPQGGGQNVNVGHFYGKILDENGKPMVSASVQLTQNKMDTATKQKRDFVIAITLTDGKGDFSIDKLSVLGNYQLLVTAVGYAPTIEKASFNLKAGVIDKDLGNIKLKTDEKQLAGVVVTANKGMLQMGIDRKVFNVDKSLTSVGGSAVDVMKNVPSVSVDIDGNVTLRNKAPQIFVDGRPTTLTLEQIPADDIESVEIITNPSAKFDASGGGAGILNIVLKKNRKPGYNGNISAGVDTKGGTSLRGNANIRQGKINFFVGGMINNRRSGGSQSTTRTDFVNGTKTIFQQTGNPQSSGNFAYGRAGLDYLIDNRNTLTVSGSAVGGTFPNNNRFDILRDTIIGDYTSRVTGVNLSDANFKFSNYGGQLSFKHNFAKPNKNITADLNYSASTNSNQFVTSTKYNNAGDEQAFGQQKSVGSGNSSNFTAQTDYSNPINDRVKLEMGLRASVRDNNSKNENFIFNSKTNEYFPLTALNSRYKYTDQVYAGYVTFSQKIKDFTYQLGGRVESSNYTGTLIDSNQVFKNSYPLSFFPSLFLTQKLTENQDLQLNYSRKINRPNFFQTIPYLDYSDSLNISRGNPNLKPEFTNLVELSYQVNLGKGNNLLSTLYYRNTNDLITNYQFRDKNPNALRSDSIFINSYENASSSYAYGLEVTSTNKIAKWWSITSNINLYNSFINGGNLQGGLNNQLVSWFGKLNNTFIFPKNYSIQFTGDYTSKTILPPGRGGGGGGMFYGGGSLSTANGYTEPVYGFDLAVKKDFLKDKAASISLSMNDIFATKVYRVHSTSTFSKSVYTIQDNERRRDAQVLRLNLNWRFGNADFSLFKRKNMKAEQESMQGGMENVK